MIVIKRPVITEKSMQMASSGLYTFEVDKGANKNSVAQDVAKRFGVNVVSVKILNAKAKLKTQRMVKRTYLSGGFKKAMVQVKKGQTIALFESKPEETAVVTTGEGEPQILKERKDILRRTKVRVEKNAPGQQVQGASPTTQRKVITGK